MIEKAARIAGPLTIVSEIPIVIVGSLNTTESKPVMIDAPLVTVLPAEALQQLQTAAIWDSTATTQHGPLTAYSPVRIHAVIRSNYHLTKNGNYYGGTIEQIPAVLGDFGAVTLEVVGAIEGRKKNTSDWDAYAAWFAPYGAEPGGFWVVQPRSRRIFWDEQLALADRQPRGSWFWPNLPPSQAVGPRTRERQLRASGGYTLIRLVEEVTRIRKLAPIASIVLPIKSVPQAPVADFTVTENVIQGLATFDASVATDPDGSIVSYFWDFGDGSPRAFGSLVAHQYTSAGPYEVTLWVVDNEGLVSKRSETITLSW